MDNIALEVQKVRKRRKKGTRSDLGRHRKQNPDSEDARAGDSSSTTETTDSSFLDDIKNANEKTTESESAVDELSLREAVTSSIPCALSFTEGHACAESDNFSETESEVDVESEAGPSSASGPSKVNLPAMQQPGSSKAKKRRKPKLTLKKGFSRRKPKERSGNEADGSIESTISNTEQKPHSSTLSEDMNVDIIGEEKTDNSSAIPQQTEYSNINFLEDKTTTDLSCNSPHTDPQDAAQLLINNLKLLLPPSWITDVVQNGISRVIKLNESGNAAVEASVFWDCQTWTWGVFVHGIWVQCESALKGIPEPEKGNIGSASDFLLKIVTYITNSVTCGGISDFKESWGRAKGFVDKTSDPCYRSEDCSLLIHKNEKSSLCRNCRRDQGRFERALQGKEKDGPEVSRTQDKYLSWEEMKEKKDNFRSKYRTEKIRGDRLEKKIERLQVKLDAALRDELSSLLINNQHKMTEMQKIFWESQRQAFAINDKRGLRWHPMMIRLALSLHCKASGGYEFLAQSGVLVLPSTRRLFDYSHFIEAKEGCQGEILSDIKTKIEACGSDKHFSFVNLMFDEMHIRSGLVTSKSTGELIGFTNLIEAEKELEILTKEIENKAYKPKLAKHVLVYLAQGITSQTVKDVVAVFSTHDLSSVQLYNRTWDVIYHLEDAGIKVISLTCDGAATNRKFFRMHESFDKASSEIYVTKNLKSGDARPLYFIIDPPHLVKTVRNCLANSFAHRNTRRLWKNNEFLSWQVIEKLFETTKNEKFRDHKLTKAHIKLTSFSCMTVRFATQVLSLSVAKSIESHASNEAFQLLDTSELVKFIRLMNRFFDCLNGKEDLQGLTETAGIPRNPDLAAYQSLDDPRFSFLEDIFLKYFDDWKVDILNRAGIHTDSEKSRMIISHQSLESLIITVKGFIGATKFLLSEANAPKVNARSFNQDPLEQYFGKLRRKQGDNKQPPLKSVLDTRLNLHAQSVAALGCSKGNTTVDNQKGLVVDSAPLRSRKKPKKNDN